MRTSRGAGACGLVMGFLLSVAASTATIAGDISYHSILRVSDQPAQLAAAKQYGESFEVEASANKHSPIETELRALLSDPALGYAEGKKLAAIFSAAQYAFGRVFAPVVDKSTRFDATLIKEVIALNLERNLSPRHFSDPPNTLYVYWKNQVFTIPNWYIRPPTLVSERYVFFSAFVESSNEEVSKTAGQFIEFWCLDVVRGTITKSLTVPLAGVVKGRHAVQYGARNYEPGLHLAPFQVYYRLDVSTSEAYRGQGAGEWSQYFLHQEYAFDDYEETFKLTKEEMLEGNDYLRALSEISDPQGMVASTAGMTSLQSLYSEFLKKQTKGRAHLEAVRPCLRPAAQAAAIGALATIPMTP